MLPWDGNERRLVSFVDYGHNDLEDTDVVLISVDDLYIQYDTSKGYNIDSLSPANIMITQANDTMSISIAVANLTAGQSFAYKKRTDSETTNTSNPAVIVEVCSLGKVNSSLDYAIISVFLDNGEDKSTCREYNTTTAPTTVTPTTLSLVSSQPSTVISWIPSDTPSDIPSKIPSNKNTTSPTRPTSTPKPLSIDVPTLSPNDQPVNVVLLPTDEPSLKGESSTRAETSGQYEGNIRMKSCRCIMKTIAAYIILPTILSVYVRFT
jgi:hypothetical protein